MWNGQHSDIRERKEGNDHWGCGGRVIGRDAHNGFVRIGWGGGMGGPGGGFVSCVSCRRRLERGEQGPVVISVCGMEVLCYGRKVAEA